MAVYLTEEHQRETERVLREVKQDQDQPIWVDGQRYESRLHFYVVNRCWPSEYQLTEAEGSGPVEAR